MGKTINLSKKWFHFGIMISIINKIIRNTKKGEHFMHLSSDGTDAVIHENALCLDMR